MRDRIARIAGDVESMDPVELLATLDHEANHHAQDPFTGRKVLRQMPVQIDEEVLMEIADRTGGRYFRATDSEALREVYREIDRLERSRISEIRLRYHYREAQLQIERMRRAFKDRDYPRVESLQRQLQLIAHNMTKVDPDFSQVSDRILLVGNTWVERARIRREFNAKPLKIQGIIIHEGDPFAIVNDVLVRIGDQFQGMRVVQIEPNQVYFDFQGERIPLVFRRF